MDEFLHQSVLLQEAVDALVTDKDGFYIDGTFGRGGHSRLILDRLSEHGKLLVVDKDIEAIEAAGSLQEQDERVIVAHRSFADIAEITGMHGAIGQVAGVLLDLGVSSPQLDAAERGFSFSRSGPLDMRMDTSKGMTAGEWVNETGEVELARVFFEYGEERFSRRIARAIVKERAVSPFTDTLQLAEIVKLAHPAWEKHKHPATRVFQAIRIFINDELKDLEKALGGIAEVLGIGGRMVVISFHSLEDRLVKQFITKQVKGDDFPPGLPVTQSQLNPTMKRVGKPVKAGEEELAGNLRARSAVLRVAEKIA
ncbi:MAG: 16S rRNA (cytosine(1402)-N(4))-methyltransferase RsmH [Gammaproteobacteria bacterium]|nr:16S rRNA (cytosine(1402)-N(4))-methyltransferase RsmH [Gammaproteobacteria bacterium]